VAGRYWIVVGSPENYRKTGELGFSVHGFKSTRRREVSQMSAGDKLIFYLTGVMKFAGIASVQSDYFEDHTPVWGSPKKPAEDYPFRVKVRPELVLDEGDWLDVKELAPRMAYTKKWPPEHWRLAFQGNLHSIPPEDYELIAGEMRGVMSPAPRS
jgi:predicted RNA-binding protein